VFEKFYRGCRRPWAPDSLAICQESSRRTRNIWAQICPRWCGLPVHDCPRGTTRLGSRRCLTPFVVRIETSPIREVPARDARGSWLGSARRPRAPTGVVKSARASRTSSLVDLGLPTWPGSSSSAVREWTDLPGHRACRARRESTTMSTALRRPARTTSSAKAVGGAESWLASIRVALRTPPRRSHESRTTPAFFQVTRCRSDRPAPSRLSSATGIYHLTPIDPYRPTDHARTPAGQGRHPPAGSRKCGAYSPPGAGALRPRVHGRTCRQKLRGRRPRRRAISSRSRGRISASGE